MKKKRIARPRMATRLKAFEAYGGELFLLLDPEGTVLYASPSAEHLLARSVESIVGKPMEAIVHPSDLADLRALLARSGRQRGHHRALPTALRLLHATGNPIPFEGRMAGHTDDAPAHVVLALHDARGHRATEDAYTRSADDLGILLDHTTEALFLLDADLRLRAFNRTAAIRSRKLLGIHLEVGMPIFEMARPDRVEELKAMYAKVLAGERINYVLDISGTGQGPYLDLHYRPTHHNGKIDGVYIEAKDVTAETKATRALQEQKADLHALIDNMPEVFWSMDAEGRLITCNTAFQRFVKKIADRDALPGTVVSSLFPAKEHGRFEAVTRQVLKGEQVHWVESYEHPAGTRHYEVKANPIRNEGVITGVSVLSREITERVRREDELRRLKEQAEDTLRELDKVMECSSDLICTFDQKGVILSMNAASMQVLGFLPEEMTGRHYGDFTVEHDRAATDETGGRVLGGQRITGFENQWRHKDGRAVPLRWAASLDEKAGIRYGIAVDMTERKEIEARLEQSAQRLQNTIESITDGFFTLDFEWRFIQSNGVTENATGIPREQLIGRSIWEVFPDSKEHGFLELYEKAMNERVPISADIHEKASDTWLEVRAYPVPEGISVFYADIGDRKKAQEALVEANERYRLATRVANEAHWDWDLLNNSYYWGEGFRTLFGLGQNVRDEGPDAWSSRIHEDDRERVLASITEAATGRSGSSWSETYRFRGTDGTYAWVLDRGEVLRDTLGKPIRMVGAMRDVTEERKEKVRTTLLHEASRGLAGTANLTDGVKALLRTICGHTGIPVGEIWMVDTLGHDLVLYGHYSEDAALDAIASANLSKRVRKGEGLPGKAWETNAPVHWTGLPDHPGFLRRDAAGDLGLQEGLAIPVIYNDAPLAVIVLMSPSSIAPIAEHVGMVRTLGQGLAPELAKRRSEQELGNFFTLTKDLLMVTGTNGAIHKVNPAWTSEMGLPPEDLLGRHFSEFMHADDVQALSGHTLGPAPTYFECRMLDAGGGPHWYAWTTSTPDTEGLIYCAGKDIGVRKATEERLLELTENLTTFQESITDALYILDTEWRFTHVNAEGQRLLRRDLEALMGRGIWEEFPEAMGTTMHGMYHQAMESGDAVHFDLYYPPLSSWFEIHAYPSPAGLAVFFRDITESRTLERLLALERKALAENMEGQRSLQTILSDLLMGIDELLPGMCSSILSVDPSGQRLNTLAAPGLPDEYNARVAAIPIEEGHASCGTAAARRQEVHTHDIATDPLWEQYRHIALAHGLRACWSYPVFATNGRLLATFANYFKEPRAPGPVEQLVAERVTRTVAIILGADLAEESERLANERYELVSRATNDATWDWDIRSGLWNWGDGFRARFGYDPVMEPATIASWQDHLHPDDSGRVMHNLRKVLRSPGLHSWEDEYRFIHASGSIAHVLDRGFVIRDASGAAIRMVGAMQDITERKERELAMRDLNAQLVARARELETSNAELERFAFIASHDLQEPLRMITSFLQLVDRRAARDLDERTRGYIRFAVEGAQRMKQLILDLLEYSRLGSAGSDPVEVDMGQVMDRVCELFEEEAGRCGARIEYSGLPVILADKMQMTQLMQNLVGNALRYRSEEPPRIIVRGHDDGGHWTFSVTDNGIGIDPSYFERVFIIFQRLHHGRQDNATGIGLAICKKIVEHHHGRIWVGSRPGEGSTFHFTITKPFA